MWPVILRELRAESRRPFTFWLRVLGAIGILLSVAFTFSQPERWNSLGWGAGGLSTHQAMGRLLFGYVNAALFLLIVVIAPLLTVECINREKREGTLGLLFLTPLRAQAIVIGKSFVHSLRALTLVLTVVPVLAVPLLMGGVAQQDLALALLIHFSALALALSAGLIASCSTERRLRAIVIALALSFALAAVLMRLHAELFDRVVTSLGGVFANTRLFHLHDGFIAGLYRQFEFITSTDVKVTHVWIGRRASYQLSIGNAWNNVWLSGNAAVIQSWLTGAAQIFLGAMLLFLGAIQLAALQVRRSWRVPAPTARAAQRERAWYEPRFSLRLFRRRMTRTLERNPIGWLQQYSARARLTKWCWCLFVVAVECLLTFDLSDIEFGQPLVFLALLVGLSFSAAGSFRQERENGAFELLLVTPLRVWDIVVGRMRGVWMQFLPALVLATAAALYVETFSGPFKHGDVQELLGSLVMLFSTLAAVPLAGMYWSVRSAHFLASWLALIFTAFVIPIAATFLWIAAEEPSSFWHAPLCFCAVQLSLALACALGLMRNLNTRRFATA